MAPKKEKPNKYLSLALGTIITIIILVAGFVVARFIADTQAVSSIFVLFLLFVLAVGMLIMGTHLKKKHSWLPIDFGIGIIVYVISRMI